MNNIMYVPLEVYSLNSTGKNLVGYVVFPATLIDFKESSLSKKNIGNVVQNIYQVELLVDLQDSEIGIFEISSKNKKDENIYRVIDIFPDYEIALKKAESLNQGLVLNMGEKETRIGAKIWYQHTVIKRSILQEEINNLLKIKKIK